MAMTYDAFAEDEDEDDFEPLPTIVDGFEGVRVRRVYAHALARFAIGEAGELFSWGLHDGETLGCGGDEYQGTLGHGDLENQPSPKRLEALRGVRVSCVSVESEHGLALAESGLVYAWGYISLVTPISSDTSCSLTMELVPKPVEALRGVRVGSIAQGFERSYAVADSGELWTWAERDEDIWPMLAHGEQIRCPVPKTIEALQGCKVYAVDASESHTLALADNGSVYAWANDSYYKYAAGPGLGLLCLTDAGRVAGEDVQTLQRISALRVACGL
jgi:alpha-tubulin suppressor-like RCC1 family protein